MGRIIQSTNTANRIPGKYNAKMLRQAIADANYVTALKTAAQLVKEVLNSDNHPNTFPKVSELKGA